MSGRIVHEWNEADLAQIRQSGGDFEAAIVAASETDG